LDLRPDLPDSIVRVVERAIVGDASQRYQTAGEFEHALVTASGSPVAVTQSGIAGATTAGRRSHPWRWVAGIALAGAVISIASALHPFAVAPRPVLTHFTIGPPYTSGSWPRVSPDGRFVVFGAIVEGRDRLWVRALDNPAGRPLMNTVATESPFWSPDSSALCFFDDGKLKRIPIESGDAQPEVLADAPTPHGGDWSGQTIVFGRDDGLYKITLDQNTVVSRLTKMDPTLGEFQHAWP